MLLALVPVPVPGCGGSIARQLKKPEPPSWGLGVLFYPLFLWPIQFFPSLMPHFFFPSDAIPSTVLEKDLQQVPPSWSSCSAGCSLVTELPNPPKKPRHFIQTISLCLKTQDLPERFWVSTMMPVPAGEGIVGANTPCPAEVQPKVGWSRTSLGSRALC